MALGAIEFVTLFAKVGGWNDTVTFFGDEISRAGQKLVGLSFYDVNLGSPGASWYNVAMIFNNGVTFVDLSGSEDNGVDFISQLQTVSSEEIRAFHKANTLAAAPYDVVSSFKMRIDAEGGNPGLTGRFGVHGIFLNEFSDGQG